MRESIFDITPLSYFTMTLLHSFTLLWHYSTHLLYYDITPLIYFTMTLLHSFTLLWRYSTQLLYFDITPLSYFTSTLLLSVTPLWHYSTQWLYFDTTPFSYFTLFLMHDSKYFNKLKNKQILSHFIYKSYPTSFQILSHFIYIIMSWTFVKWAGNPFLDSKFIWFLRTQMCRC
jgi:hypothetical protein